jgi:hemoglobin
VNDAATTYQRAGGAAAFEALVTQFYALVADDPLLRPLYPDDLEAPSRHLTLFLMQYFGGPTTYSDERGHPRLRMRHLPFAIDQTARDRWMVHMLAALDSVDMPASVRDELRQYFDGAATFLINRS